MRITTLPSTSTLSWSPHSESLLCTGTVAGALDASFSTTSELEIYKLESNSLTKVAGVSAHARFNRLAWGNKVIAGGLESGELALWNPEAIMQNKDGLHLLQNTHSGPVRGIDFNPNQTNLLASGATDGEIFIWDINNPTTPYSPGSRSPKLEDVSAAQWNRQVPHILATGSNNGFTVIWDLRSRKELMQLAHPSGRKIITGLAWNNDNASATQICTAADDDASPVVLMWDLRNARAPERQLAGHSRGILSLSWCSKDSELLLSCGKDNRTILFNTSTSTIVGDLHHSANWSYDVQWSTRNPDLVAVASFDGKITIHSLMGTKGIEPAPSAPSEDPFAATTEPQDTGFKLQHPPAWLRRPVSAVWGFGGALACFFKGESKVCIKRAVSETEVGARAERLYAALADPSTLKQYCAQLAASSKTDKDTWKFMQSLFDADKSSVIECLGFDRGNPAGALAPLFEKLKVETPAVPKPSETFSLFPKSSNKHDTQIDTLITRAVTLGDFSGAVDVCIAAGRMSDALLIGQHGSEELQSKTRAAYFAHNTGKTYVRLLAAISSNDFSQLVDGIVLDSVEETWKDVLALLCTHAPTHPSFKDYVKRVGERVSGDAALLCFLLAGDVSRVLSVWNAAPHSMLDSLQSLVEKVSVFRVAASFTDNATTDFPLAKLYDAYRHYAIVLDSQGLVEFAWQVLSLVPQAYYADLVVDDGLEQWDVLRDRLYHSLGKKGSDAPPFPFVVEDVVKVPLTTRNYSAPNLPSQSGMYAPGAPASQSGYPGYTSQGYQSNGYSNTYQTNTYGQSNNYSNNYSGQSNAYSGQSNAYSGQSNAYSGQSNTYSGQSNTYSGQSNTYSGQSYSQPGYNQAGYNQSGYGGYSQQYQSNGQQGYQQGYNQGYNQGFQQKPTLPPPPTTVPAPAPAFQGAARAPTPTHPSTPPPYNPYAAPASPAPEPEKEKGFPPGDRSNIPPNHTVIVETLQQVIKTTQVPSSQKRLFADSVKKVDVLFDDLNARVLVPEVITALLEIADCMSVLYLDLKKSQYDQAEKVLNEAFMARHFGTTGKWLTGLKKVLHTAHLVDSGELVSPRTSVGPTQGLPSGLNARPPGFNNAPSATGFAPPTQGFANPPPSAGFTAPPPTTGFTSSPSAQGFQTAPPTQGFQSGPPTSTPPTQGFQSAPPTSTPPTQGFQSAPPTSTPPTQGFSNPPPTTQGFQSAPPSNFGSRPPSNTTTPPPNQGYLPSRSGSISSASPTPGQHPSMNRPPVNKGGPPMQGPPMQNGMQQQGPPRPMQNGPPSMQNGPPSMQNGPPSMQNGPPPMQQGTPLQNGMQQPPPMQNGMQGPPMGRPPMGGMRPGMPPQQRPPRPGYGYQ